ncbi:MAG: cysteine--tRNA ligase [Actinomycetota bacterium]|nr:cysteine--tRNA ligase [Actinomycetota bacterium]
MSLRVYDSAARSVVAFEPAHPPRVSMYVCGPTVYGLVHIGNARTFLWFDLIRRYLSYRGFEVTFVMNYTDVDDKIIERAREEDVDEESLARRYAEAFEADMKALGVDAPDILARATEHIPDMVAAIEGLVQQGFAYEADGNVFFAVERFDGYGRLSGRSLADMRAGQRVEPHPSKRHPLDFALWKAAKEEEPSWSSPWGPGRPGWHIECSVMSIRYLGMGFDLHGGGTDLIFPHHENELTQAEALTGEAPFVRHWLHSGMVQMQSEKMSKSLGNIVTARQALERFDGEVVRMWALSGSYRTQVVFSEKALHDASAAYERWKTFHESSAHLLESVSGARAAQEATSASELSGADRDRFIAAMDDDFNSAVAVAVIHDLVREGNGELEAASRGDSAARVRLEGLAGTFAELTWVLGFSFAPEVVSDELAGSLIDYLLELREQARAEREFERADEIRHRLGSLGVVIEDTPSGARWRLAPRG